MRIFRLLAVVCITVSFWSCKEEAKPEKVNQPADEAYKPVERVYASSDTVRFTNDSSRMAVIGVMKGIMQTDSSFRVPVDVCYYIRGRQVSVFSDTFSTSGGEELSHYFEATDTNGNSCERFFTVTYGYPACGYTQHHLTFSANEKNCYFVAHHSSVGDGAYGEGLEFFSACAPQSASDISSAEVSREPTEADENIVVVSYTDSTVYHFDGKVWTSKSVTEKGKIYRTAKEAL